MKAVGAHAILPQTKCKDDGALATEHPQNNIISIMEWEFEVRA